MSEPELSQTKDAAYQRNVRTSYKGKDWLADAPFGDAFQRSIYLFHYHFRWLVFIFFIGGFIMSIVLFPINSMITTIDTLIANEVFAPIPDVILLIDLLITSMAWGFLQKFILFFGTFLLGTLAVYYVLRTTPSLHLLSRDATAIRFPFGSTIAAGLITATILTLASILPFLVSLLQVLFFFLPVLLVLGQFPLAQSLSLSISMRVMHWIRILSALILGYLLIIFAGTLGLTFYLNIEVVLNLYGISLGFAGLILLSLLTQIPVAMVAPLVPLFSVAFFGSACGTYREKQHQKYMRSQQSYQQQPRYIPLEEPIQAESPRCQHCGSPLGVGLAFCTQCGQPIKNTQTST